MNRRELAHLTGLFLAVLAARYVLFTAVGLWGDLGFYTYDAMLINEGQTPFVDFIGRSPLFNYAFAAVVDWLPVSPVVLLRAFIALWWLLAGVPVYLLGRRIHSHAGGLAAGAIMQLSPFMLVYGYWTNTQSLAALLAISGVAILVYREDWIGFGVAGLALGIAFLSRRSVITVLGALGVYALYQLTQHREVRSTVFQGVSVVVGFLAPLGAGYLLLADFDPGLTLAFAETHAWGLISSSGRGGFPLISEATPPETSRDLSRGHIPIFHDICQRCGYWTARTFAKTSLVTVPIVAPLLFYFRDITDRYFSDAHRDYTFGVLLALLGYGVYHALAAGYVIRVGAIISLVLFGFVAFWSDGIDRSVLYDDQMVLLLLVLTSLAAGYLYRNRILHTYYFLDFMPYLSVVAGVLYAEAWAVIGDE